jgi:membrane protein
MRIDRDKSWAFARFLWRRFIDDQCFEAAGALAYTTLFALVPLAAVALAIVAMFPVFGEVRDTLTEFIFSNFVPAAGNEVQTYLFRAAEAASQLRAVGVIALIVTALVTMSSIEQTFNRIWRVSHGRPPVARFVVFWTALTLGPMLIVSGVAVSSYLFSLPLLQGANVIQEVRDHGLLPLLPFLVTLAGFCLSYLVVPNTPVRFRHALAGGLLATLLFEAAKRGFGMYVSSYSSYQAVYGALVAIPIFLLWLYLSWVIVLLGASFAASLGAFNYQRDRKEPQPREYFPALVEMLALLRRAQLDGQGLTAAELAQQLPRLSDEAVNRLIEDLDRLRVVQRTDLGGWVLSRDLGRMTLREIYRDLPYTLPRAGDSGGGGSLAVLQTLERSAAAAEAMMDVNLADLLDGRVMGKAENGSRKTVD